MLEGMALASSGDDCAPYPLSDLQEQSDTLKPDVIACVVLVIIIHVFRC